MITRRIQITGSVLASLLAMAIGISAQAKPPAPPRSITVVTEPSATIWLDGVRYGVSDDKGRLTVTSVPTGTRALRVRARGHAEVIKPLAAASRGDVIVKLVKTTDEAELAYQSAEELTTVDREKAIAEYQRAVKLRPKYFQAYVGLARAYSERGDIENAHKSLQSAKRLRPADPEGTAIEGRLLKDSGEEDKAIATFKRAVTLGRGFQPEAHTGLGLLYKERAEVAGGSGNYDGETAAYAESAKHLAVAAGQLGSSPDAAVVYQILGLIYERQKKYKEAIALYENFLRLFPNSSEAGAVESFIVQIKKQMAEPQ